MISGDGMKRFWQDFLVAVTAGLIVPMIIVSTFSRTYKGKDRDINNIETTVSTEPRSTTTVAVVFDENKVRNMDLNSYLIGVLLAEMPASFETEALTAQAVVARTYTLKRISDGKKHKNGDVCVNPDCCQAYSSETNLLSNEMLEKVKCAVSSTDGQVLMYDGAYIEATYFSCSGGRTEDAVAVWGTEIPYLQAVDSPGEENAAHYMDDVSFTIEEFCGRLGINYDAALQIQNVTYTDGGGVNTITISGKEFSGTQLRSALGLRSTMFSIALMADKVTVTTRGFGHRVGMSQYGAQAMAKEGKRYTEILSYYYQGTTLCSDLQH